MGCLFDVCTAPSLVLTSLLLEHLWLTGMQNKLEDAAYYLNLSN